MAELEFPYFYWQAESTCGSWKTYGYELINQLNKAASKNQKTATISSDNERLLFNLEKMTVKRIKSKTVKKIRCIINSDKSYLWSFKDDGKEFSCTPRMSYFLEVAFKKKISKSRFHYKKPLEIDFVSMIEKDLDTGKVYDISRVEIDLEVALDISVDDIQKALSSRKIIEQVVSCDEDRIFNILFSEPLAGEDLKSSFEFLSSYLQEIISALEPIKNIPTPDIGTIIYEHVNLTRTCHLYSDTNGPFSATLILTNIEQNINKFFLMQMLFCLETRKYGNFTQSGRIGAPGKTEITKGKSFDISKSEFEEMFFEKTGNHWKDRMNFKKLPGKYDLAHIELFLDHPKLQESLVPSSKMDKKIQELLLFAYNKSRLLDLDKELCIDSPAVAFGKFSPKQILEGSIALNEIIITLKNKGKNKDLLEACDLYYMKVPHHYGQKPPSALVTVEAIQEEINMLQKMANPFVFKALSKENLEHPIDKRFSHLKCTITPIHDPSEFYILKQILNTTGPTHKFKLELKNAFSWSNEKHAFLDKGNKKLLWHGTQNCNLWSIMRMGLQLPSPELPCTNLMFGRGIYFADVSSKSANYCCSTWSKNEGLLFLCEVSLGKQLVRHQSLSQVPCESFDSVFGVGRMKPCHSAKSAQLICRVCFWRDCANQYC